MLLKDLRGGEVHGWLWHGGGVMRKMRHHRIILPSMSHNHTWYLYRGASLQVRDFACRAPRSGCGAERRADVDHLLFTRRGVFVKHAHDSPRGVTAEPAQVLLYNAGEAFCTSHPGRMGDEGTVLAFAPEVARDVACRIDRATWRDASPVFPTDHLLAAPDLLLRVFRLRQRMLRRLATTLEIEEESLGVLAQVVAAAARAPASHQVRQRHETRARRREEVESVKQILAAAPERDVALDEIARAVGRSPFHLTRLFREETGLPIHRYHLRLRATLALDRLAAPSHSLSAIGLDLGLASHAHFTTTFRRVFGETPSAVRRSMLGDAPRRSGGAVAQDRGSGASGNR